MSTWGTKHKHQTVLEWTFTKHLAEYGETQEYSRGWNLEIRTALGAVTISEFGWGFALKSRLTRKPYFAGRYVSALGFGLDFEAPDGLGWSYSGDAVSPEDMKRYYG